MRRFAGVVALAVATAGCFGAPGPQDRIVIEIPIDTVVRGAPGSVHVLTTTPVAPEDVGRVCAVAAEGINNESVHPNSDLFVRSNTGEVVLADVERAPNVRTVATDTHTVGTEITVAVRLGPDGVFSGGLVVELDCPAPPRDLNREVSGPFTGTTVFDFSTPRCSFVHQVFDATYQAEAGGSGTFHIDTCVSDALVDGAFPVDGSFVLTTPSGATLTGSVTGRVFGGPPQLDFTLTVTGGTGQFQGVTGTVGLDGTWDANNPGAIAGTLVGSLQQG
jgi:hypothetical protein